MTEYLVEGYLSRTKTSSGPGVADLALGAQALAREGKPVRFLRSIFVPEDETCFYLYEAPSAETVRAAAARAGLRFHRITEAVSDGT
jgi:hypothetical protein